MTALAFRPVAATTRHAKVLLIGEAGVGKTHAALTFPKPVVIDAEGSVDWFADRFAFQSVNTKSYADVTDLLRSIQAKNVPCETVIIDSLTSIYNGLVNAATEDRLKNGSDDLRPLDWGRIKRKFSSLLDELYHKLPYNVVCVGWIKPEYAKPGDTVNGQRVKPNDLVKLGETFDGDRKTMYAFDFVFKIEGNDGTRTRAMVIKSRSGALKAGQVIADFSWATLRPLLPSGGTEAQGMTDDEQIARDAGILADPGPKPPSAPLGPSLQEAINRAYALKLTVAPNRAALTDWAKQRNLLINERLTPSALANILVALDAFDVATVGKNVAAVTDEAVVSSVDRSQTEAAPVVATSAVFHPDPEPDPEALERQAKALRQRMGILATEIKMDDARRHFIMRQRYGQFFKDVKHGEESSKMLPLAYLQDFVGYLETLKTAFDAKQTSKPLKEQP